MVSSVKKIRSNVDIKTKIDSQSQAFTALRQYRHRATSYLQQQDIKHTTGGIFPKQLIVTIPVYNDAQILAHSVGITNVTLSHFGYNYLLVLADDGSTDATYQISRQLSCENPRLKYVRLAFNQGRGKVLATAWGRFQGDVFLYFDSDLSTELKHIPEVVERILSGYDIVTGSRYLCRSKTTRPPLRRFVSLFYNFVVRALFRDTISDHQCGFKGLSKRAVEKLIPLCRDKRWFWDTEMVVLAKKLGYKVSEIPVEWREMKWTRTPIRRLVKDIYMLGKGLITLFIRVYLSREIFEKER